MFDLRPFSRWNTSYCDCCLIVTMYACDAQVPSQISCRRDLVYLAVLFLFPVCIEYMKPPTCMESCTKSRCHRDCHARPSQSHAPRHLWTSYTCPNCRPCTRQCDSTISTSRICYTHMAPHTPCTGVDGSQTGGSCSHGSICTVRACTRIGSDVDGCSDAELHLTWRGCIGRELPP